MSVSKNSASFSFFKKFQQNKRGYYCLIFLLAMFFATLFAEFVANDKPILLRYQQKYYFPILQNVTEQELGGVFATEADFRDEAVLRMLRTDKSYFAVWPLINFSYDSINYKNKAPAPAGPSKQNLLGTDDQGRDVLARVIYGVRISFLFGILLSFFSLILAILLGSCQGYFAGKIDIIGQRFVEIWSSMPTLFLLIILSSFISPGFFSLLFLLLLFSWIGLSSIIRAEFLRIKNFDFVIAAKSLGAGNFRIMMRHILPNAAPLIIANLPFLISGSIVTLTSLDFLGLGMPAGSPSLGELLAQGKNNIEAIHLGITGFVVISVILTMLIFVGEALRDAFDVRK